MQANIAKHEQIELHHKHGFGYDMALADSDLLKSLQSSEVFLKVSGRFSVNPFPKIIKDLIILKKMTRIKKLNNRSF